MNKMKKFFIALAILLLVAGSGICITILAMNEFNYRKVINSTIVENTHAIEGSYTNIEIDESINDVELVYITEGDERVETRSLEDYKYEVKVEDDTLFVKAINNRKWYEFYTWVGATDCKTTIYVKNNEFNSFKCNISTGDIALKDYKFNSLNLDVTTGDIILENVEVSNDVVLDSSTGDIEIKNTNINGKLTVKLSTGSVDLINTTVLGDSYIKSSTGSIKFDKFNGQKIEATTSTGSIKGSLVGDHDYTPRPKSDTGDDDNYPESVSGAPVCILKTSTGDINITKA